MGLTGVSRKIHWCEGLLEAYESIPYPAPPQDGETEEVRREDRLDKLIERLKVLRNKISVDYERVKRW